MSDLLPGSEVAARGLRWEVVTSQNLGTQQLLRLRGLEGTFDGQELDLVWPFEEVTPIMSALRPTQAAPLPGWSVYHQAFLLEQAHGIDTFSSVQPGRIRIESYQLVPVLRAIRMSRVRLLLGDGVGLGKTIQAGLVITELVARRLAHRILVVSPAGPLLDQWHVEMSERFGLRLDIIDRAKLEEIRRSNELGANPFDFVPLGLVSIDFLKQESVLEQLERSSYDVIVIDEAHHCMDIGTAAAREDSQRRRLSEVLAKQCDALLLLTATPHDGNDRSFASLCELLDPSLVDGRGVLRGERYRHHVIRRLKNHVLVPDKDDPSKKVPLFPERKVAPIAVTASGNSYSLYREFHSGLLELVGPELRRAFRNKSYSDVLSWFALLKRSVSSLWACRTTLEVVRDRFGTRLAATDEEVEAKRQRIRSLRDYSRRLQRFGSLSADEQREQELLEADDIAEQLLAAQRELRRGTYQESRVSDIVAHLDRLITLAERAGKQDAKLDTVTDLVKNIRTAEPEANILIYTEYVDSQAAIAEQLQQASVGTILKMSGDDGEKERGSITKQFREQNNLILVSTDAAAEGLNLHYRCHNLIHFELPFNPNRLEQRNGRIDRYGQTKEPQVKYLYLKGTFEERILLRLIAKYEKQRARLTFVPNTLGVVTNQDASQAKLLRGLMEEDNHLFKDEPKEIQFLEGEENEGSDEATRELLEEIDRSLNGFKEAARTHSWLVDTGLNAEESLVSDATAALSKGHSAEQVDLAQFVCHAAKLDGGGVQGEVTDSVFRIQLPPQWVYGLEGLPGFDATTRQIRLTTQDDVTADPQNNSVGYIGRAHPLVRRAIDRVRHISFGAGKGQDVRVSCVKAKVKQPEILFTLLGKVMSRSGRELECVLAVRVSSTGKSEYYADPQAWLHLVDISKAIRTTDVWHQHFASWADGLESSVRVKALEGFRPYAESIAETRKAELERERSYHEEWLRSRAKEISGDAALAAVQAEIDFGGTGTVTTAQMPPWASIEDPLQRLAAFSTDRTRSASARAEAESVLRIYKQRMELLDKMSDLMPPEVVPLGMLMILPEDQHGV